VWYVGSSLCVDSSRRESTEIDLGRGDIVETVLESTDELTKKSSVHRTVYCTSGAVITGVARGVKKEENMSVEGVLSFYKKADTDEELGKQIAQIGAGVGALDEVAKIAAAAGFEVTASDLLSVEKAVQGPEGEGLSDDELSAISGGVDIGPISDLRQIKRLDVKAAVIVSTTGTDRGRPVAMSNEPTVSCVARHRVRWNR